MSDYLRRRIAGSLFTVIADDEWALRLADYVLAGRGYRVVALPDRKDPVDGCGFCGADHRIENHRPDCRRNQSVPVVPVGGGPVCEVCGLVIEDGEAARAYGGPGVLTVRHSDCPVEDGEREGAKALPFDNEDNPAVRLLKMIGKPPVIPPAGVQDELRERIRRAIYETTTCSFEDSSAAAGVVLSLLPSVERDGGER